MAIVVIDTSKRAVKSNSHLAYQPYHRAQLSFSLTISLKDLRFQTETLMQKKQYDSMQPRWWSIMNQGKKSIDNSTSVETLNAYN